jgi:type VI secretion system protein ImpK
MSDNPFSEPEDDHTIIRPSPGGRRPASPDRAQTAPPPATPASGPTAASRAAAAVAEPLPIFTVGTNLLVAAAEPLILLLARLWNAPAKPFAGDLRERITAALQYFEQRARDAGVPMEQLRPAHYALCASIDDVVMNTPWGATAGWDKATLTATYHLEASSGARFFDQLAQLCRNPAAGLPVIELMYLCLSLGFMGPYRQTRDGAQAVEQVRRQTHDLIATQLPPAGAELSPRWAGIAAPFVPRTTRFPPWVIGSAALAVIAGLFLACMTGLNAASDDIYGQMLAAPPSSMPKITRAALVHPPAPSPEAPAPTAIDRLGAALKTDIDPHALAVTGTPANAILRIGAGTLFASASATLLPGAVQLLERVAAALRAEAGNGASIQVIGYTDNQPISTVKFPSNYKLSVSRAEAVRDVLQKAIGAQPAISAEGRADADPVDTNATAEGRERNRRIEIVVRPPA